LLKFGLKIVYAFNEFYAKLGLVLTCGMLVLKGVCVCRQKNQKLFGWACFFVRMYME